MTMDSWMADEFRAKRKLRKQALMESILALVLAIVFSMLVAITILATTAEAQIIITDVPQGERVVAIATAYTASVDETDSTPEITAAGTRTRLGIAACPKRYAFGTRIVIEGQEYICEDRMASKFSERFDILVATKDEAFEFGKKRVEVAILP